MAGILPIKEDGEVVQMMIDEVPFFCKKAKTDHILDADELCTGATG